MFDFDATKLMIVGVLALIVLGPNELPRVMRQLGQMLGKMRRMAGDFQGQFMDAMREAELEDIRKEVNKLGDAAKSATTLDVGALDPAAELRNAAEGVTPAKNASAPASISDAPLDLAPPEPFKPVTSEDLAAAFETQPAVSESMTTPAADAPAAPGAAADAFYLRPGAVKTQPAGVELAPDEEITFRKAPAAQTAESPANPEAPRRRSARPTSA